MSRNRLKKFENIYRLHKTLRERKRRSYQLWQESLYRLPTLLYQEQNARLHSGAFEINFY